MTDAGMEERISVLERSVAVLYRFDLDNGFPSR